MSPTLNVTLEQRTFSINVTKKRLADKYISGKIARVFENFGKTIFTHLFTPFQTHVPLKKTKDLWFCSVFRWGGGGEGGQKETLEMGYIKIV